MRHKIRQERQELLRKELEEKKNAAKKKEKKKIAQQLRGSTMLLNQVLIKDNHHKSKSNNSDFSETINMILPSRKRHTDSFDPKNYGSGYRISSLAHASNPSNLENQRLTTLIAE
jgi:hypothetical protein